MRRDVSGFTLIELLTVVAILGILTTIAMPHFAEYRQRAFDAQALTDLRNAAVAEEAYYLDNESYLACEGSGCTELPGIRAITDGVSLRMSVDGDQFEGEASHERGTGRVYVWRSEEGGIVDP